MFRLNDKLLNVKEICLKQNIIPLSFVVKFSPDVAQCSDSRRLMNRLFDGRLPTTEMEW